MLIPKLLEQVLIALAIGGLIGAERERLEERKFIGLRTSAILAMGGPISVKIASILSSIMPVLIYTAVGGGIAFAILKIRMDLAEKNIGLTTSACVFVLVLASILVGYSYYFDAVAISIIATFLLAGKERIKPYVSELSNEEMINALKVAAAAFIIYPLLPSETISPLGLINPQKVLLFILLVLGVRFAAFVASRQLSRGRGLPLTGLLGGGVSSLATAGALSEMSEGKRNLDGIAFAVILAAVAMVVRNLLIVSVSSVQVASLVVFPGLLMVAVGLLPSLLRWRQRSTEGGGKIKEVLHSPLSFKPALKLGAYFLIITVVGKALQNFLGTEGLWIVAFLGGLVSSAAVAVSVLSMLSSGTLTPLMGSMMVIIACTSSIFVKIILINTAGNKEITKKVLPFLVVMILAGILPLIFLY